MTDIVEVIFLHAVEKNFHPYMNLQEYRHYMLTEERVEASIRQLLPQEQEKLLEELHNVRNNLITAEQMAASQYGLSIGLELSRL